MMTRRRAVAARPLAGVAAMILPALLALVATAMFSHQASAATPVAGAVQPPLPPPPNALPPNPAMDARVTTYIQKRFWIGDKSQIQLGPVVPTAMPGLFERPIKILGDKGQTVGSTTMFTNANEDQMMISQFPVQFFDLTKDPWEKVDLSKLHLEDRPVMGPASAPLTIVEFADFECPFCARAFGTLETMVHSTYKDKIRVIYKNYPLNSHPWAIRAAIGAECARLQNPETFWDFARDYYSSQGSITVQNIDDHIHATAKRLNLDVPTLDACMAGKAAKARIEEDQKDGNAIGVSSTPTLLVNGIKVVGLPQEKAFDKLVDQQLNPGAKEMLRQ
jgi:protein-disulfide isomerase